MRDSADRANENLGARIAAQTELATFNIQKARRPVLYDLHPAPGADAKLRHAAHPTGIAVNFRDVAPLPGTKHFKRHQALGLHSPNPGWEGGDLKAIETQSQ
jgi:hypothetical protein